MRGLKGKGEGSVPTNAVHNVNIIFINSAKDIFERNLFVMFTVCDQYLSYIFTEHS